MVSNIKAGLSLSVKQLAKMANLTISGQEEQKLASQLKKTLLSFSVLKNLKGLTALSPTFQVTRSINIIRQDKRKDSLPRKSILKKGSYFVAKK